MEIKKCSFHQLNFRQCSWILKLLWKIRNNCSKIDRLGQTIGKFG
uniref:Uncharacterized protein n=1 Tax=Setaria italica TaxID=4555 RepID=K3XTT5_SETIT